MAHPYLQNDRIFYTYIMDHRDISGDFPKNTRHRPGALGGIMKKYITMFLSYLAMFLEFFIS